MRREKRISQKNLRDGIAISLDNSQKHLDGVEALIAKNLLDGAVILLGFAVEEFGRAVYLRERLRNGLDSIEECLERSHQLKYDKAFSVLPLELKTIWKQTVGGYWGSDYWDEHYWSDGYWAESIEKEEISDKTRTKPAYLHFNERTQMWERGIKSEKERLKVIVDQFREYILKFEF